MGSASGNGRGIERLWTHRRGDLAVRRLLLRPSEWQRGERAVAAAGGDLSGTLTSSTVSRLQNRPLSAIAPANGQVLGWDGTQWTPQTVTPGGGGGFSAVDKTVSNTYTPGAKQTFVAEPVNQRNQRHSQHPADQS